jgi:hypothetical protein
MYLTKGDYKELYYSIKDNYSLNKYNEFEPFRNNLYHMFDPYPLFSDKYDIDISCKYMDQVIRFLSRYNLTEPIINDNLVNIVGNEIANTDIFFYSIYSVIEPKEMVRISLEEYIRSFFKILMNNYNLNNMLYTEEMIINNFKDIKIDKFKSLLEYLAKSKIENLYDDNERIIKYGVLAIIVGDIYANNKDYHNIDTYLDNTDYYINKLALNGYITNYNNSYEFIMWDYTKILFGQIDSFINDNKKKTIK